MESKAVFLDRDGTICYDIPYCDSPDKFLLIPGAAKAIRILNGCNFKVIVVTNQSGVRRGYFTEEILKSIHDKMEDDLRKEGAFIDAIYYCPHSDKDNCSCRKPKGGMIVTATGDFNIDLHKSYVIGDNWIDISAGLNCGCCAIKIGSDSVFGNLLSAVDWIIRN